MSPSLSFWATLGLASAALAVTPGGFEDGGSTLVSAMMMFVGNEEKVYIMDKAEGNAAQIKGHPAWASRWDLNTRSAVPMDVPSNIFCSSGMHLPNGSFVTFGGNQAVGRGGNRGNQLSQDGFTAVWDSEYQDFDGSRAIRILNPCRDSDNFNSPDCQWFDDATLLSMKRPRWYSTAEPLADGTIVMIGGFTSGGYINRNYPNTEPNGGGSQNSFEFFPARPEDPPNLPFLTRTSGLNTYVHTFLMPSGKMFLQANTSTTLWDPNTNTETPLPDMPKGVVRVYPASGATAMLPLTPANKYNPTILFCGGSDMEDEAWGDFAYPYINTWEYPASKDCQRITPEPLDGSSPAYEQDDDLPVGRSMGQFIILPDGKLLVVNGAEYGTAGYAQSTRTITNLGDMPYGESLATGPVLTPAIYDPNAPRGSRWSTKGLQASTIPRMYHSSAMLLPDASVLIAGSNPNVDVNLTTIYKTTYASEVFYPPYFSATTRPVPKGVPSTLSYGGPYFNITIPASSYSGSANDAADSVIVSVIRGGFTTHAMNMGQRFLQLENTYTVQSDGTIILHVAQMPPTPQIFQPGPGFVYVTINGIPSNGTYVIVGSGKTETQATQPASSLPASVRLASASGSGDGSHTGNNNSSNNNGGKKDDDSSNTGMIAGIAAGVAALVIAGIIGAIVYARRRRANSRAAPPLSYPMANAGTATAAGGVGGAFGGRGGVRNSDSSAFVPLQHDNSSQAWNASSVSLAGPYKDDTASMGRPSGTGMSLDYDPYASNGRGGYPQGRY